METKPTSLRSYAKHRGVSCEAVSKAVTTGRLRESIVIVSGAPKIANVELADREWEANTRPRIDGPRQPEPRGTDNASAAHVVVPDYNVSRAIREAAAARREAALADMAEIDVAEKKGAVVAVDEARSDVVEVFTIVKTKLLGVPSRFAQRLPHLAADVVPVLDALLREALEELSAEKEEDDESVSDKAAA